MIRLLFAFLSMMVTTLSFGQQTNYVEFTLNSTIQLNVSQVEYLVTIQNNYELPEGVDAEDQEKMQVALLQKNEDQFEKFLTSKGFVYQLFNSSPFTLGVSGSMSVSKTYRFVCKNFTELAKMVQSFKKIDYVQGAIGEISYAPDQLEMKESELWTNLYKKALEKAKQKANSIQRTVGKFLDSTDIQSEIVNADTDRELNDFGELRLTVRFRFEIL